MTGSYWIKYEVTGQVDGRWHVRAIDERNHQIGATVIVSTPREAFRVWLMLSGYWEQESEPTVVIDMPVEDAA